MSAQPVEVAKPPEGILAGAVQDVPSPHLDRISEPAGATDFDTERALLDSLSLVMSIQQANIPALSHLGLGASFSWRQGERVVSIRPDQHVKETFNHLAEQWRTETMVKSSPVEVFMHPLYLQIIGMGRDIVPLLLAETRNEPGDWFLALRSITGHDPVRDEDAGNVDNMADAWLRWAREQGYDV